MNLAYPINFEYLQRTSGGVDTGFDFARNYADLTPESTEFLPEPSAQLAAAAGMGDGGPLLSPEAVAEIIAFNDAMGNAAGALLAKRLGTEGARTVVTGQQPTLLGAPLYNLAKALGAVQAAATWEQNLGRPVVPVFWVADDDHDFEELRTCRLLGADGVWTDLGSQVSRGGPGAGTPASSWTLDAGSADRVVRTARTLLAGLPNAAAAVSWVAEHARANEPWRRQFCRSLVAALPAGASVVFVSPTLKCFRRAQVPILLQDLEIHDAVAQDVEIQAERWHAASFPVPLRRQADALNFFYHAENGQRLRLRQQPDGSIATVVHGGTRAVEKLSVSEWRARAEDNPERFSPGVLTRPLLQDLVLKPLAYFAGPGEIAYLAQTLPATARYGVARGAVLPRPHLVAPLGLSITLADAEPASPGWLGRTDMLQGRLLDGLGCLRRNLPPELSVAAVDQAFRKTQASVARSLERLRRNLQKQARQHHLPVPTLPAYVSQYTRPTGGPQERFLTYINVLAEGAELYG